MQKVDCPLGRRDRESDQLEFGNEIAQVHRWPHVTLVKVSLTFNARSPALRSVLYNKLGVGADTLVSAARELPQLVTLCGIEPWQEYIDLDSIHCQGRKLNAGDAKLLQFDLSTNQTIKTLK